MDSKYTHAVKRQKLPCSAIIYDIIYEAEFYSRCLFKCTPDFLSSLLVDGVEVEEGHAHQDQTDGHGGKQHMQGCDHHRVVFAHTRLVTCKTEHERRWYNGQAERVASHEYMVC